MLKNKQHEKVLTVMLSGKPVTAQEFETTLGNEIEMYRLSTYMWKIRKMGGIIKVNKTGKHVDSYELTNPDHFKDHFAEKAAKLASFPVKLTAPAIAVKAPKATKTKPVAKSAARKPKPAIVPVEAPEHVETIGEVPNVVDEDFDHIDVSDLV